MSKMTFPAAPDLIAAIASSARSSGKAMRDHRRRVERPERRKRVIWCHVSYIRRPVTPYTVTPLNTSSVAKSKVIGLAGTPSIWTRPAGAHELERLVDRRGHAAHLEHHVHAESSVTRLTSASTSFGVHHVVAPIRFASASRVSLTSLQITRDAPAALQIPAAKMPIGPHPVMSTAAPGMSAVSAVWNAFPIGSWMPPMS